MDNFTFYSPTEFVFGKDTELEVGNLLKKYGAKKVLLHYGSGSIIKNGLLAKIEDSIKAQNISYVKLGGAQPNPIDTLVYEGIDLCKKENVDFILAIGGGSAIDSAKAIAVGACSDIDFWDFFKHQIVIKSALKVATVLTIPAAGSEGSPNAVITKTDGLLKRGIRSPLLRPVFSILNPALTSTLPQVQTAYGISDMMAHVMERYFSNTQNVQISDHLAEAVLLTVIDQAPIVFNDPTNYDASANIMWAGTIAHNGTCGVGRVEDWSSHILEHQLSALYDCPHGAGLSVIFPAWMRYVVDENVDQFVKFATRVWGIKEISDKKETALMGIKALEDFYISLNLPISFDQLGAKESDINKLLDLLSKNVGSTFGNFKKLNLDDARKIYKLACR